MSKFIIILLPRRLIYTIVNLEDKATSVFLRKFWRSHWSQKTLLGSEGNRGIFLGIDMVFCKFYKINSLEQYKPSKLLILGPLKFDLEIGKKKYLDAKTCFIDSLMTCCVFFACKIYEINTFNFSEIISVCCNDSFGNSNPKPQYFR